MPLLFSTVDGHEMLKTKQKFAVKTKHFLLLLELEEKRLKYDDGPKV